MSDFVCTLLEYARALFLSHCAFQGAKSNRLKGGECIKVSVDTFCAGVEAIHKEQDAYKNGHDGSDGFCDCIGMIKGSIERGGGNPTGLQGTNYAARYSIEGLKRIKKADLFKGCVVLKSHKPGEDGYDLPKNYKPGGKYYNGDLTDFSHIGTVTSVDPLVITHMTSPTSKQDTKIGDWKWYGKSPHVDYEGSEKPMTYATVIAVSGSNVNLRKTPSTAAALVDRVPINSTVEVLEDGGEWCKVRWKGKTGYMMRQFLAFEGETPVIGGYNVQISGISRNEAIALCEKYPNAIMTAG